MAETVYGYCLRKINEQIPYEILRETFDVKVQYGFGHHTPINLDSAIESTIIRASVLKDLQAAGGRMITIPLGGVSVQLLNTTKVVFQIPLSLTGGRNVMDVYRINFVSSGNGYSYDTYSYTSQSVYTLALNNILDSSLPPPLTGTSQCEVVGPNVIVVNLNGMVPVWMEAELILEDDDQLSHLNPRNYELIADMCVARCKSHIYNKLRIKMDQGYVEGGVVIGEFKNIIDNWSDVENTYKDLMKQYKTVSVLNDSEQYDRLLNMAIGKFT